MKDRIKVLRIIARLNVGGPAIHVLLLNAGLNKERFSSYLATGVVSEGEGDITDVAKKMGIEPFIIPELKREVRWNDDFSSFLKLYRLIKDIRPDIVHTHTAKAGALGRVAAILNRVPIKIHTFHGHIFHSYFDNLRTLFFMMVEKMLSLFTNRIVVISQSQLNDVKDRYKIAAGRKCVVVPLGLDLESFLKPDRNKGDIKRELSIDEDTMLVGIVGRLVEVKNHKLFLDAVKRIRLEAPDVKVKFLIVGDGKKRYELESYARELGIDDSVIFMGWRSDLESIYKNLDIVCLTSLNEGTPISLIEAMASGKAVVSTDVGGVRDVVADGESGFLSPTGDVERFSQNLLILLRNKDKRDRMGEIGRAFVSKRFSKERLIRDVEMLYEEELKKRSAR